MKGVVIFAVGFFCGVVYMLPELDKARSEAKRLRTRNEVLESQLTEESRS